MAEGEKKFLDAAGLQYFWEMCRLHSDDQFQTNLQIFDAMAAALDEAQAQINELESRVFIGTNAEYETANANNEIPINTIVIITDDEGGSDSGGDNPGGDNPGGDITSTTSKLGYAILGQMKLGE